MPEWGPLGAVRGALSNERPYRDLRNVVSNERDLRHLVELALPPGSFRSVFLEIDTFHRDRRIPVRRGRSPHEAEQFYIRFRFPDTAPG